MKAIVILLLIALAAGGGWYAWKHRPPAAGAPLEGAVDAPLAPGGSAVLAPAPPALPPEAAAALEQGDRLWTAAGADPATAASAPDLARAYTRALRALYNQPGAAERERELVRGRLTPLGTALFFTRQNWPADRLFAVHTVQRGESPDGIARKYGMSRELINRLRGKDVNDSNLRVGDTLKVLRLKEQPEGEKGFAIRIDKSDFTLDLFIGGIFARRYVISTGAVESPTPTGRTRLVNRVWHPDWTHPETKQVLKFGDPENILGPVWLPFDAQELGHSGIGIHGYTGADGRMQARLSHGCIRLQNQDAEEVFQVLSHPDRSPCAVEVVE